MITVVFTFIVYVIVFGILFWACDYAAKGFLPAEIQGKVHIVLVLVFVLLFVAFNPLSLLSGNGLNSVSRRSSSDSIGVSCSADVRSFAKPLPPQLRST